MAEIVGVIGSSLAIFDSLQKLRRYVQEVIHAPEERIDFLHRLDCVDVVKRALDGCKSVATPNAAWTKELDPKAPTSPVYRLLGTMESMSTILTIDPKDDSVMAKFKNLKWHSEKKKLDTYLNQIKDHCISILIVLQWGEMDILKALVFDTAELTSTLAAIKTLAEEDRRRREPIDEVILTTARTLNDVRSESQEAGRQQLKRLASIEARLEAEENFKMKERERAERKEVEKWLSPLEFQQRQQVLFEKAANVQKGQVGKWFFECEEFNLWKQGKFKVLRGYGEPGTGKTILSSVVVDELTNTVPETPVLCVYLEKTEGLIQTAKNIQGSLLKQLIQFRESGLSQAIRRAWEKASRAGKAPNDAETTVLLKAEIESHSRVFVVVDGLDEATEESRQIMENRLQKLSPKLSVLIMARVDGPINTSYTACDICSEPCIQYYECKECTMRLQESSGSLQESSVVCFACKAKGMNCVYETDSKHILTEYVPKECEIEIKTPDEDIAHFLKSSIEESFPEESSDTDLGSRLRGTNFMVRQCYLKPELRNKIVRHIVDNADGRFLLAREFFKHFQNKTNLRAINEAMEIKEKSGTDKVFPFYTEDMDRIMTQPFDSAKLAMEVLSTIYFAKRNLTLAELLQALATEDGETSYHPDGETDGDAILYATKGLVTLERVSSDDDTDNHDMIVRFEHLTRRDFFDVPKNREKYFPTGRVAIAQTCLTFLSFDVFAKPCNSEENFQEKEKTLPFITYVVEHWGEHVKESGPGATEVVEAAVKYLKDPSRVDAFIEAAYTANTRNKEKWDVRRTIHPLHICAWFDLGFLMPSLNYEPKLVNVREETHGQTPLMYACRRGNIEMVRRLLQLGALVNKQSEKGRTALFEAIFRLKKNPEDNSNIDVEKSLRIVNLLLNQKLSGQQLDVNIRTPKYREQTALMVSLVWQQIDISLALLEHPNLEINSQDVYGACALHIAAGYDLIEVVQVILNIPSVAVDLTENTDNRTALIVAARFCSEADIVEALLKHGANPNWKDNRGGTPLLRAAEAGREQTFEILVKSMENPLGLRCIDEDGRGLWHWAAMSGNEKILKFLGTGLPDQVNACDGIGMTPLHVACEYGKPEAAKFLLEMGADCTILDKNRRSPFVVAEQYGNAEGMNFCHSTLADGEIGSTAGIGAELPTWSLALQWQLESIKNRIASKSLSLDLEPHTRRTALHCTLIIDGKETGKEDVQVDILRELLATRQFSPDDVGIYNQTPLHISAMFGNVEATKLLLSSDANLEVVDRYGMTPLTIAFKNQFLTVAVLLIEAGATIEDANLGLDELLFSALTTQNFTAVERLMAAGANRLAHDDEGRTPDMLAKKDARLLAILKRTRSYRFKTTTMSEKEEIGIELIENTIGEAEEMLSKIRRDSPKDGVNFINGKSARSVRFLPFESRAVDLGDTRQASEIQDIHPSAVPSRSWKDVENLLEGLPGKESPAMNFRPRSSQEAVM